MSGSQLPDHYEALQVSPRADQETVSRVFRHLAKRFHPDNPDSGDPDRFNEVMEAFRVLSDPELRASYDARYQQVQEARWRIFSQDAALDDIAADRRMRAGLLSVLYTARRNDPDHPGVGGVELSRVLDCPEEHLKFHLWYLKENGWIQRLDTGHVAITAAGVDLVLDQGGPSAGGVHLLEAKVRESRPPAR
jgi:curved DNA-binding protein